MCILFKAVLHLKIFSLLLLSKIGIHFTVLTQISELILAGEAVLHRHSRAAVESAHFQPQPGTNFLFTCSWDGVVPEIESVCCGYWESGIYWPFLSLCSAWNLGKHWFICRDIIYLDSFVGVSCGFSAMVFTSQIMNGKSGGLREFWLVPLPGSWVKHGVGDEKLCLRWSHLLTRHCQDIEPDLVRWAS